MLNGQIGVWRRHQDGAGGVAEIEALGFSTLWVGGSPTLAQVRPFLDGSRAMTVATGILNVWQHEPADVARERAALPDRFLLGIGIGHPEATAEYTTPLERMRWRNAAELLSPSEAASLRELLDE